MDKYWKESGSAEAKLLYVVSADEEVDEWHPASEPPKPEDFQPADVLLVRWRNGHYGVTHRNIFSQVTNLAISQSNPLTHWMHITPPK